nr:hypothetical protein [Tanacetum cinerariifolium]
MSQDQSMLMMRLLLRINRMLRMLHLLLSHLKDDEDDDMDIEADEEEEEENPAPADSVVVASTAADQALSAEETEPFKIDESAATPPPHPAYRMTARISIPASVPMPAWSDLEIVRLLAMSSPPASPLSPWSSPPPQIPFPPLPPILSPPSPVEDRPEVTLPPWKRLGIALGLGYEREVGYGITDSWDEIVETLQGAPVSTDMELGGYMRQFETRGQVIALQAQVTALQGHEGLAGGPTQPELLEEADYIPGPEEPKEAPPLPDYISGPEHADDEIIAEDQPYAKDASPIAQSPEYVPESDFEAHPEDDGDEDPEEDSDDDMDVEADEEEEEEHPTPADSVVVAPTTADQAPSAEETEPFEIDNPIRSLGYRAAMIRLRDEAASTSSPPLQLPSASRRKGRPEVTLPPQNRLDIAFGPRYEVGESSSAAAARPAGGFRADYGFVATVDREIERDPEREVSDEITDSCDEIVETLQGAPVSTDTELGGY